MISGILKQKQNLHKDIKNNKSGTTIVSGSRDNTIKLWNIETKTKMNLYENSEYSMLLLIKLEQF